MDLLPHILIVDDDREIRELLARFLERNELRVTTARDGQETRRKWTGGHYQLVILDLMLPGESGLDVARWLRTQADVPIIMLTAMSDDTDRIIGLELGADDYVPKPFGQKELLARVRAVLRRRGGGVTTPIAGRPRKETVRFSGWTLDLRRRELSDPSGMAVEISGAEHDLLTSFLDNPQRVIGRDRLLELSRTRLGDVSDRSVDVLVSRLRRKLGPDSDGLIRTVRGMGYIFTSEVERV